MLKILIILTINSLIIVKAYPKACLFTRDQRVDDVEKCNFGWDEDPCGFKICTKGNKNDDFGKIR